MLIRKVAPMAALVRLPNVNLTVDPQLAQSARAADQVEVTSLQIEREPNFGGDPYNCTGQHCITDIGKDQ